MTSFDDFIDELRTEAEQEGPEAVAEFKALDKHYEQGPGSMDGEDFARSLGFDDIADQIAEIKRRRRGAEPDTTQP